MGVFCPKQTPGRWPMLVGYGYLIGVLGVALMLRAQAALGLPLRAAPLLILTGLLAALAVIVLQRRKQQLAPRPEHGIEGDRLPRWQRIVWGMLFLWLSLRLIGLGLEVWWQPLFPWDAWTTWGVRARVWTEQQALVPFVSPQDWLAATAGTTYTIDAWHYPATVSLLSAWPALAFGDWNETAANLPWLGCALALGLGFYGQSRIWGASALQSMVFTWLLLSLPMLDTHVALAGYADIWLATVLGFAFMSFLQWARTGDSRQGWLSLLFIASLPMIKVEGAVWTLSFVPALLFAKSRGDWLLACVALSGGVIALLWMLGGVAFEVPGLGQFRLEPDQLLLPRIGEFQLAHQGSWAPVVKHIFLYSNWHLFGYLLALSLMAALIQTLRGRAEPFMRAALAWVITSLIALYLLFFWTQAARWVIQGTSFNRIVLQFVPAMMFWIMALWVAIQKSARNPGPKSATNASDHQHTSPSLRSGQGDGLSAPAPGSTRS